MQNLIDISEFDGGRSRGRIALVVMAKLPAPGRVKTRLTTAVSAQQAAAVHAAMLACTLARIDRHVKLNPRCDPVLATDHPAEEVAASLQAWDVAVPPQWRLLPQGEGHLGQRIQRIWETLEGGPAVFLGTDSPDLPMALLDQVMRGLQEAEMVLGPAPDGGYWTLAARRLQPALLHGIDWGSASVYDQTLAAARTAGLKVRTLPIWDDVDEPAELAALCARLSRLGQPDPDLLRLRQSLTRILEDASL